MVRVFKEEKRVIVCFLIGKIRSRLTASIGFSTEEVVSGLTARNLVKR